MSIIPTALGPIMDRFNGAAREFEYDTLSDVIWADLILGGNNYGHWSGVKILKNIKHVREPDNDNDDNGKW